QVKKVNKWSCKMCGIKQSLLKEYGRGSGADCRRQVQKLNAMRGAKLEECNNGVQWLASCSCSPVVAMVTPSFILMLRYVCVFPVSRQRNR
uniref:MRN complex-interacting protein N-terminal domain-containing protein n=1 Tax=Gouania willdenowi TaxID=441366 RepID=A0A8C5IAX2_GOUWI